MENNGFCLLIVIVNWNLISGQLYIGNSCSITQSETTGVCRLLDECDSAKQNIRKGIYPQQCGFQGKNVIVCCTDQIQGSTNQLDLKSRVPGEISDKMCKNYSQYIWTVELSPILLVGAADIKRNECPFNRQELVVGGDPASRREFPHMALVGFEGDPIPWSCGGTLISDQHVLTAAHCLDDRSLGVARYVKMGGTDQEDPDHWQQFDVSERYTHPLYSAPSHYHDIGIIKFQGQAKLNTYVRPACLHTIDTSPFTNVIATGWGRTEFGGFESTVLLRVILELYNQSRCDKVYKQEVGTVRLRNGIKDDLMICAGHSKDLKDTCQGDSGGPLQVYREKGGKEVSCMYDIIGVTSFGKACGLAVNLPGVYTRVSNYIKWIEDIVWPA